MDDDYRDGTDLILSIDVSGTQTALGHNEECKISYKAETKSRTTKEASAKKWKENYVTSLAASITASGFVHSADESKAGLPKLEDLFMSAKPIKASWKYRGDTDDKTPHYHEGNFIISQLNQTGKAGDDEKYDLTLENSGAVTKGTASTGA